MEQTINQTLDVAINLDKVYETNIAAVGDIT